MAAKVQTLGDLGDGPFVVAMVSRDERVTVRKGRIPRKQEGVCIETMPTISYKMNPETGTTALDRWVWPFMCGTALLVVHKYTPLMPTAVLCMMHPDVGPCKLELTAEDQTGTFKALIEAGLPPNDMREVMRDQVAKSRLAFFTAFRAALVSVRLEDRARMFKGCEDLLLSVVTLHAGTPEAMVAQQELVLRTRRETLMVACLTPFDLEPWDRQHTQKHQWPDVLRPEIKITQEQKMNWFGSRVQIPGKMSNQRPTQGTVFVVAAYNRIPDRNSSLFMGMEVKQLSSGQGSTLVHDEQRGEDAIKVRVMLAFTVETDDAVNPLQQFKTVANTVATTLANTNMASKGPFVPLATATVNDIEAVAAMVKEQYLHGGNGIVFKWARWSRPPFHFRKGTPVTMEAILYDLATHVCETLPSSSAAELALRALHSNKDVANENAGAALLLGKQIILYLMRQLKEEAERQDADTEDPDLSLARWKTPFVESFYKLAIKRYKPVMLERRTFEEALVECSAEDVTPACGADVYPIQAEDPSRTRIDPRYICFGSGKRRAPVLQETIPSSKAARVEN